MITIIVMSVFNGTRPQRIKALIISAIIDGIIALSAIAKYHID